MLQMRRKRTHLDRCENLVQTRKTNHRTKNTNFAVRIEHRVNQNELCLFLRRRNQIKLHEKKFDTKRSIHSIKELIVFESNRFQKILKKMRKRIKQFKKTNHARRRVVFLHDHHVFSSINIELSIELRRSNLNFRRINQNHIYVEH